MEVKYWQGPVLSVAGRDQEQGTLKDPDGGPGVLSREIGETQPVDKRKKKMLASSLEFTKNAAADFMLAHDLCLMKLGRAKLPVRRAGGRAPRGGGGGAPDFKRYYEAETGGPAYQKYLQQHGVKTMPEWMNIAGQIALPMAGSMAAQVVDPEQKSMLLQMGLPMGLMFGSGRMMGAAGKVMGYKDPAAAKAAYTARMSPEAYAQKQQKIEEAARAAQAKAAAKGGADAPFYRRAWNWVTGETPAAAAAPARRGGGGRRKQQAAAAVTGSGGFGLAGTGASEAMPGSMKRGVPPVAAAPARGTAPVAPGAAAMPATTPAAPPSPPPSAPISAPGATPAAGTPPGGYRKARRVAAASQVTGAPPPAPIPGLRPVGAGASEFK